MRPKSSRPSRRSANDRTRPPTGPPTSTRHSSAHETLGDGENRLFGASQTPVLCRAESRRAHISTSSLSLNDTELASPSHSKAARHTNTNAQRGAGRCVLKSRVTCVVTARGDGLTCMWTDSRVCVCVCAPSRPFCVDTAIAQPRRTRQAHAGEEEQSGTATASAPRATHVTARRRHRQARRGADPQWGRLDGGSTAAAARVALHGRLAQEQQRSPLANRRVGRFEQRAAAPADELGRSSVVVVVSASRARSRPQPARALRAAGGESAGARA